MDYGAWRGTAVNRFGPHYCPAHLVSPLAPNILTNVHKTALLGTPGVNGLSAIVPYFLFSVISFTRRVAWDHTYSHEIHSD